MTLYDALCQVKKAMKNETRHKMSRKVLQSVAICLFNLAAFFSKIQSGPAPLSQKGGPIHMGPKNWFINTARGHDPLWMSLSFPRETGQIQWIVGLRGSEPPPKRAGKLVPRENCLKKYRKIFSTFFFTFVTVCWCFLPCSKNVEKGRKYIFTLFDDFWLLLPWPLSACPFCTGHDWGL